MTRSISAVFFDVDDTLLDNAKAARAALQALLGGELDDAAVAGWDALTAAQFGRYDAGEIDFRTALVARMAQFLAQQGRPHDEATATEFERRRDELFVERIGVFGDALPAVAAVRDRGLPVGLITNSDPIYQRRKLAMAGLADRFDAVIISGEVGVSKPDPAIFDLACSALDVAPAATMYVGNNLHLDALGAQGAGLFGVWLDRLGEGDGEIRVPVVSTLAEVDALLGDFGSTTPVR